MRLRAAYRTGAGVTLAVLAMLAALGCGGVYGSDDRRPDLPDLRQAAPSTPSSSPYPAPPAPSRPVPVRPIPGWTASQLFDWEMGIGNFADVPWKCASQQALSDGQRGYHCVAAGTAYDEPGTFLFEMGTNEADEVTSVYLAALGPVPTTNGGFMSEADYVHFTLDAVGKGDPVMEQQFFDEPLDAPTGPGAQHCAQTDVPVTTATVGRLLLQWGSCSGEWMNWYTLRITAR